MIVQGYEDWNDIELLAGVMLGEARGELRLGRIGVGLTVKTRVSHPRWWGRSWREVILKKFQFSCWLDHNAEVIKSEREDVSTLWKSMKELAESIYNGDTVDFIGMPTHYHSSRIFPDWASGMKRLMQIGSHVFYRDLKEIP